MPEGMIQPSPDNFDPNGWNGKGSPVEYDPVHSLLSGFSMTLSSHNTNAVSPRSLCCSMNLLAFCHRKRPMIQLDHRELRNKLLKRFVPAGA